MREVVLHRSVTMQPGWPEQLAGAQRLRTYTRLGESRNRIPYGSENPAWGESPCSGCGAVKGELHVPECEYESCPFCNTSFASGCACAISELAETDAVPQRHPRLQRGLDAFERWAIKVVVAGVVVALLALFLWLWREGVFRS